MKVISVTDQISKERVRFFKSQRPDKSHVSRIINEEAILHLRGKVIGVYKEISFDTIPILTACLELSFNSYVRNSGILTSTINLNASPRSPRLDNKCLHSKLRIDQPQVHELFLDTARKISKEYQKYFKKQFGSQVKATYSGAKKVEASYRIQKTPFTGGVINKNSALPYHFDSANTHDGISCMVILKEGVAGGELILPQLDIGFACQNNYMLLFDGKTYLHGVTPIVKAAYNQGNRFSIVFYNNNGMALCLPPDQEELHYQCHLEKQSDKKRDKLNVIK